MALGAALVSPMVLPAGEAGASPALPPVFSVGGPLTSGGTAVTGAFALGPNAVGLAFDFVVTINNPSSNSAPVEVPTATTTLGGLPAYTTTTSAGLVAAAVTGITAGTTCSGALLQPGASCDIGLVVLPLQAGNLSGTVDFGSGVTSAALSFPTFSFSVIGDEGYVTSTTGAAAAFFDTYGASISSNRQPSFVDQTERQLNAPIVGAAATQTGEGYYLVASDGGIFSFGDATYHGSHGGTPLNKPIVGMAGHLSTTAFGDGGIDGYWEVASDGGIFTYGDAPFDGSHGGSPLNKPIVAMAATPDGKGYWLVASDGGIFTYGDATFHGSTGAIHLNRPIVGMAPTPDGGGYWLEAADAGSFTEGNAAYLQEGFTSPAFRTATIAPFGDPVPAGLTEAATSVAGASARPASVASTPVTAVALAWHGAGERTPG